MYVMGYSDWFLWSTFATLMSYRFEKILYWSLVLVSHTYWVMFIDVISYRRDLSSYLVMFTAIPETKLKTVKKKVL